jgi:hypothetical protein
MVGCQSGDNKLVHSGREIIQSQLSITPTHPTNPTMPI